VAVRRAALGHGPLPVGAATIDHVSSCVVQTSAIHGQGVFATRAIACGEWIIEYMGERLTDAECEARSVDWVPDEPYHTMFFEVSADLVIDGGVGGNDSRFINHSCAPNCVIEIAHDRVHVHAAREIAPGEELTFDYAYEWEARYPPQMRESHRCACAAPRCRGSIFLNGDGR